MQAVHFDGLFFLYPASPVMEAEFVGEDRSKTGGEDEHVSSVPKFPETAETRLERRREHIDALVASVPGVVWEAWGEPDSSSQRINYVSPYVETLLGYTVEEWLNTPNFWYLIVHPDDKEFARREVAAKFASGAGGITEFRWVAKNGDVHWMEARSVVITDQHGHPAGMRGVTMDITARKRAEEAMRERAQKLAVATAALAATNRELDQFAYITSHDLKAPLRGIANLSRWIEEDLGDRAEPETLKHLELMRGRVQRMEAMIEGILQYSRIGRMKIDPEKVDIKILVKETVDLLDPPPDFRVSMAGDLPVLQTVRLPLQQVFQNLIGNAIKHHPGAGNIIVSGQRIGEFWDFSVKDDGPGIAPHYQERIFGIFQTLQARDKLDSTGIGLSIVKKIVEQLGGAVTVQSDEGQGADFHFTWPNTILSEGANASKTSEHTAR